MKPGTTRKFFLVLAVLIAVGVFAVVWRKYAQDEPAVSSHLDVVEVSVDGVDGSNTGQSSEVDILAIFNPTQNPSNKELRDTVLSRLQSKTPLTESEKAIIGAILKRVNGAGSVEGVDTESVRFSDAEVQMISDLLER